MHGGPTLNFIELAKLAGLGGPSIIGVVLNPAYGPWIAFRAALIVDVDLDSPGDAVGFDPCPGCVPRSCIAACPGARGFISCRMGYPEMPDSSGRGGRGLRAADAMRELVA